MLVEVKGIAIRHNGTCYAKGDTFEIDAKQHERIKDHVDVIDEADREKTIDEMTVPELKEYAAKNNIDLGDATKKDAILLVLQGQKE